MFLPCQLGVAENLSSSGGSGPEQKVRKERALRDSNPRPSGPKPDALSS
jgi:hypothetical protein